MDAVWQVTSVNLLQLALLKLIYVDTGVRGSKIGEFIDRDDYG